jgi:hypothetical protein
MSDNMSGSNCLPGCMCSKNRIFFFLAFSSRMRRKRSSTDDCHIEYTSAYPLTQGYNGISRPFIVRILVFKIREHALRAICGPKSQYLLVRSEDLVVYALREGLVKNFRNFSAYLRKQGSRSDSSLRDTRHHNQESQDKLNNLSRNEINHLSDDRTKKPQCRGIVYPKTPWSRDGLRSQGFEKSSYFALA